MFTAILGLFIMLDSKPGTAALFTSLPLLSILNFRTVSLYYSISDFPSNLFRNILGILNSLLAFKTGIRSLLHFESRILIFFFLGDFGIVAVTVNI